MDGYYEALLVAVVEGSKTTTRGGVNDSLKNFLKYLATVPKSPPNTQSNKNDVHDPNKWVNVC